jgi:hypothetical protein
MEQNQNEGMSDDSQDSLQDIDIKQIKEDDPNNFDKFKTVNELTTQKQIKEQLLKEETSE